MSKDASSVVQADSVDPAGPSYDAAYIFALGQKCKKPLPVAASDEIVIFWPGGSLSTLLERDGVVDKDLFLGNPKWGKKYPFYNKEVSRGIYHVRLQLIESASLDFDSQCRLARPDEFVTPAVLVLACCLCFRILKGQLPIEKLEIRCAERYPQESNITIEELNGKLSIEHNADENVGEQIRISFCRKARNVKKV